MNPGDLVVLAVAVVVTTLGSAEFVAVTDHRHTVGQQERSEMSVAENPSSGQWVTEQRAAQRISLIRQPSRR